MSFVPAPMTNFEINQMLVTCVDPLVMGVLPRLSVGDLVNLIATSRLFREVVLNDDQSVSRLIGAKNIFRAWLSTSHVYINRGFLSSSESNSIGKNFSMQTVLNVAKWLRGHGNTPVPPHALGVYQPRALLPVDYIRGMNGPSPDGIYLQLYKIHKEPQGVHDSYGEKAFYDEDDFSATNVEKAQACEQFVRKCFQKEHPELF